MDYNGTLVQGSRLRMGIVGGGVMGLNHTRALLRRTDVEVIGIVEPNSERRRFLRSECRVPTVERLDVLLERCDAAIIASPAIHHFYATQTLLNAGIHVLVEKPMATSLEQARKLVELAEHRERVLMAGHILRHHALVSVLRQLSPAPRTLHAVRVGTSRRITDIGVVLDLMLHDLDLVQLLLGQPLALAEVRGYVVNGLEECCHAELHFPGGIRATLTACRMAPTKQRLLMLEHGQAWVAVDWLRPSSVGVQVRVPSEGGYRSEPLPWPAGFTSIPVDDALQREHDTFINAALGLGLVDPSPQDALVSLEMAFSLLRQLTPSSFHVCHSQASVIAGEIRI